VFFSPFFCFFLYVSLYVSLYLCITMIEENKDIYILSIWLDKTCWYYRKETDHNMLSNPYLYTFLGRKLTRWSNNGRVLYTNRSGWEVSCGKHDQWKYNMFTTQRSSPYK
jgi:hypothetical protein